MDSSLDTTVACRPTAARRLAATGWVWASLCTMGIAASEPQAPRTPDPRAHHASEHDEPIATKPAATINRKLLNQSLRLGRGFLLRNQLPNGLFRYRFDFRTLRPAPEQGAVRQAGALWALALIHQDRPTIQTRKAVLRGLAYYEQHSSLTAAGGRYVRFPGAADGQSGCVALVALTLVDFLRAEPVDSHPNLREQLAQYLVFLVSLQRQDGRFYANYLLRSGESWGLPSPYYDGEILLALVKAAKFGNQTGLRTSILQAAEAMWQAYAKAPIRQSLDRPDTKGFFQWGCMAYAELCESKWPETTRWGKRTIRLAHWMIDVHKTRQRHGNTAYALEGILVALHMARQLDDHASAAKFQDVAQRGLSKLTTWQVGGPAPNTFLREYQPPPPRSVGGILQSAEDPRLRIDITQHQMHAVILARRYLCPPAIR